MNNPRHKLLRRLQKSLPSGVLHLDPAVCRDYAGDKWFASHLPDAAALPRSAQAVADILRFASRHRIPVTARGAGHGYVGGCVPARGGIALCLKRMNRIKEIHPHDFVAVVEPGVIVEDLQEATEKRGLFYPPDPASRADCSVGGTIATNAGGPRCLKYGVTRDYVLGLQIALADGTLLRVGSRTHKNKTGFDITRLLVGSEGLLAVITEATLKLLPLPPHRAALSVGFASMSKAVQTLHAILGAGFLPCALELADAFTLAAARRRTGSELLSGCHAHLIIEIDGQKHSVQSELAQLMRLVGSLRPKFILRACTPRQCENLWQLRRQFSYALRDTGLTKLNEDIVVPRGCLEDLFRLARSLQTKHDLAIACFGHAGDGNIHVNMMVDFNQPGAKAHARAALNELFQQVLAWGGVITGEHGIGLAKKQWWPLAASPALRHLHLRIKQAFDPHKTLNPGKFI